MRDAVNALGARHLKFGRVRRPGPAFSGRTQSPGSARRLLLQKGPTNRSRAFGNPPCGDVPSPAELGSVVGFYGDEPTLASGLESLQGRYEATRRGE
jgi:hypothetical protein